MIVIGIDPGSRVTGYGIIQIEGSNYKPLDFGCIRPPALAPSEERYCIIYDSISELITLHHPSMLAIETQYVDKNVQSAIKLGMARGVAVLAGAKKGLSIHEYSPTKAKSSVCGSGRASKTQVQNMIGILLGLESTKIPTDAADALALAICHLHTLRI